MNSSGNALGASSVVDLASVLGVKLRLSVHTYNNDVFSGTLGVAIRVHAYEEDSEYCFELAANLGNGKFYKRATWSNDITTVYWTEL